jgi:hypothetical protein
MGGSNSDSFCTVSCAATDCEPGKQPNAADSGCDECMPGKHSNTNGTEPCSSCTAGFYSTGAAINCMQVSCAQPKRARIKVALTNFLAPVRVRQGERDDECRCMHRVSSWKDKQ